MPIADQYVIQNNCQHNQILAARNRVVCQWPAPDAIRLKELERVTDHLAKLMGNNYNPVPFSTWGKGYTGNKRARYMRAVESLESKPLSRRDRCLQAFPKLEKIMDPTKDPRMIQARSARFNVSIGNYLKAFEDKFYHLSGRRKDRYLPEGRIMVKGMNNTARAALLHHHWTSLRKPVQLGLDCSRFDGHVSIDLLRLEHNFYKKLHRGNSNLTRILDWQTQNVAYTSSGIKYTCPGRRMSGDMNTAIGNCVLMITMMCHAMKHLRIPRKAWRMADDGDDCCIMVEEEYVALLTEQLPRLFEEYGHKLKIENIARSFSQVTLCSGQPIRVGGRRVMILNPRRAIGKSRVLATRMRGDDLLSFIHSNGICQQQLYSGVPVLQAHAQAYIRCARARLKYMPGNFVDRLRSKDWDTLDYTPTEITLEARLDFAESFGIDIDTQQVAECWFDALTSEQLLGLATPLELPV